MDQQRPLPEYSAVQPPSLSSEYPHTNVLCPLKKSPPQLCRYLLPFFSFSSVRVFFSKPTILLLHVPSAAPKQPASEALRKTAKIIILASSSSSGEGGLQIQNGDSTGDILEGQA